MPQLKQFPFSTINFVSFQVNNAKSQFQLQKQMFKKILLPIATLSIAGGIYLYHQKVSLKNQHLRTVLSLIHNYNSNISSFVFRNMIRFEMIKQTPEVKDYVFSEGFDFDAIYLPGLVEIGFDTVEVGPLALIPSCTEEKRMHFGNKTALGNINVFYQARQSTPQKPIKSKVGISITPNFEIIQYAPYLIEQNMLNCLKQFEELNYASEILQIHRYILKLTDTEIKELQTPQYLMMIQSLIVNSYKAIDKTLEDNKRQFPHFPNSSKPQIFIEIPSKDQNPKLYDLVSTLPQVKHLIVDGAEYEVVRVTEKVKKKVVEKVQLALGKRRLTFQSLLEKVIHDSL